MNEHKVVNFFYEMGQLRRVKREGWRLLGVEHPESVAEHSLRAAQVAWILAKMEGLPDPNEAVTIAVFHDIGECRVGDLHKIASRYGELDEDTAVKDQCETLDEYGKDLYELLNCIEKLSTPAGIVAKDADLVELAVRAKEYIEQGFTQAQDWIETAAKSVRTDSAKKLLAALSTTCSTDWWKGLKKL